MKFVEIVKKTNIDFIGLRNKAFILSLVLVVLGCIGFVMVSLGKANLSVDFTGGTQLQVKFSEKISIGDLRGTLTESGLHDVQIQEISGTNEFLIKTKMSDAEKERAQDTIGKYIAANLKEKKFEIVGSNMVGSTVGRALKKDAIIALVIALVCIIIYIAWRFTFIFGIAATIATFHDVLTMLGIFYIFNMEMNILFITALMTIAGYSLTDTVVVFDRIRENMAKMKAKSDLASVINFSINEVLSRTLITSLTTAVTIGAILFLGGEVLFDFAFALFIGVLVGTYSSVFIASPLIFIWRRQVR